MTTIQTMTNLDSRQLSIIYKMIKNTKNLDTLPTNTHKINRKNLYSSTTFTHAKRQKYK